MHLQHADCAGAMADCLCTHTGMQPRRLNGFSLILLMGPARVSYDMRDHWNSMWFRRPRGLGLCVLVGACSPQLYKDTQEQ